MEKPRAPELASALVCCSVKLTVADSPGAREKALAGSVGLAKNSSTETGSQMKLEVRELTVFAAFTLAADSYVDQD